MKQLPRTPRRFRTREQKLLWREVCVALSQLGLVDQTARKQMEAHVDCVIRMRDNERKHRGVSVRERLRAIDAVGRSVTKLYAPNIIRRTSGRLIEEIQRRLFREI